MPPQQAEPSQEYVHPSAGHAKKKRPSPFSIEPISAFYIFLIANLISAVYAPIQDCDETFNYYEPLHYLSHGYGLQTWEYSPEFSIRSWTYIGLHAIPANIRRILPQSTKLSEFYFVRYVLAFGCAFCQALMFRTISLTLNPRIGLFFVMAVVASPGNFHASTAFLPSSFAMYMAMLGTVAFMNWRGGLKSSQGIFWFAMGGLIGWPFAAALCAPFIAEEVFLAILGDSASMFEAAIRLGRGAVAALCIVAVDACVNWFFYKKLEVVPWNIVAYNIFSSTGGPNLYGTEPWTYYFKNLLLNHNLWFLLALASLPLFIIQKALGVSKQSLHSGLRTIVFLSPFYMWLAIFTLQPHKEERFMYPAYPFLALNAAMALHMILSVFGNPDPKTLVGKIPARLKLILVTGVLLMAFEIGAARIYGIYSAYSAPMKVYAPLGSGISGEQGLGGNGDAVCFGKEWYRFPSSYFLPRDMRAKFVRSEFRGLLPGEFAEARTGFGFWSGTWLPPTGMNDRNEEDVGKYVDIRACDFLVDTQYPEREGGVSEAEPDYVGDGENWEVVKCVPFLDAERTGFVGRALWVPESELVPEQFRRKWGRHCLLQRRKR